MSNKIALDALTDAKRAINSMKVEAETAGAGGDQEMLQDACEQISNEGLAADTAIRAAIAALEAMEAGGWLPISEAPKDGTYIHVQQQATYRWLPYKQASQEFKRGKKGRWQRYTGYGFDNADLVGSGWMNAELPTPPKD